MGDPAPGKGEEKAKALFWGLSRYFYITYALLRRKLSERVMDLFFLFGCGNRGDFRLVGEDLALHIFIVCAGREILCKPGSGFLCMETKGLEQIRGGMGIDSAGGSIASDACAGFFRQAGEAHRVRTPSEAPSRR